MMKITKEGLRRVGTWARHLVSEEGRRRVLRWALGIVIVLLLAVFFVLVLSWVPPRAGS